ncbi:MAG: lamin tail domain-containing protein [Patescibacteria group bacterium]|nr:lamin tail domain-containing protein [Patescibacteria group bacterium]
MKGSFLKLLALFLILSPLSAEKTYAYFQSQREIGDNTLSTGCWATPATPSLAYPANNTYAGAGSAWDLSPHMDWTDSISTCPLATISYQYESYLDGSLSILAYQSGWLADSRISAPGTPNGSYYWRVRAKDQFGHTSPFSDPWLLVVDRTAPVISNISVISISTNSASINWKTNEPSTSQVGYGVTSAYGLSTVRDTTLTVSHTVSVFGLNPSTAYHFQMRSKDQAENGAVSGDNTFTTLSTLTDYGDVVINEIMWMGSKTSPYDEWIELRNMTSSDISLNEWQLEKSSGERIFNLSGTISANGYFLISRYAPDNEKSAINDEIFADQILNHLNLKDSGEQITLRNNGSSLVDQTPYGHWTAGENGSKKKSMERNNVPGEGTLEDNWHTCLDEACNDETYWDFEESNYGTPRSANHSKNDPTTFEPKQTSFLEPLPGATFDATIKWAPEPETETLNLPNKVMATELSSPEPPNQDSLELENVFESAKASPSAIVERITPAPISLPETPIESKINYEQTALATPFAESTGSATVLVEQLERKTE